MTDYSNITIPKPKNWQDLERQCRLLFQYILNDRTVQNNGRPGQRQHGVDIFGRQDGQGTRWIGIQCKNKEGACDGEITEDELRAEVVKSKDFVPTLSGFTLVTTAPVDAVIQEVARKITQEQEEAGKPLTVSVWGWAELESRITAYPDVIRSFHPDATPFTDQIIGKIESVDSRLQSYGNDTQLILEEVRKIANAQAVVNDGTSAVLEAVDKNLHAEIDGYRDLLNSGKAQTAIDLLTKLKNRIWESASPRVRFRIITNIAAARHVQGNQEEAIEGFLKAVEYQPDDKVALANVALAYLLQGDAEKAISAARTALDKDSSNAEAACYLIQAQAKNKAIDDPLILVSASLHNSASVKVAEIFFYRARDDERWQRLAIDALTLHPKDEQIRRAAAEAQLHVLLSTRGFLMGQRSAQSVTVDNITQLIGALQELWDKQKNGDAPYGDGSMAHNLAQAYRIIDNKEAARTVTDEALRITPNEIYLIKLRATLYLEVGDEPNALKILERIKEPDPEVTLIIAEIKLHTDPNAARNILEQINKPDIPLHYRVMGAQICAESYLKEKNTEKAFEVIQALDSEHPNELLIVTTLASVQRCAGDLTTANQTLSKAKSLLNNAAPFFERFGLAKELEHLHRYDDVVEVLQDNVETSRDSLALRLFMASLINSDRRTQTYNSLKALPDKITGKPFYLHIAIALHTRRGDYTSTESALDQYLAENTNDLSMQLRRLEILTRRKADDLIRSFLNTSVEKLEGDAEDQMRLAQWLDRYGFHDRALKLAYEVRLKHRSSPQVHLLYVGLLLKPNTSDKIDLEQEKVGVDTFFVVKNGRGKEQAFLIEPDESLRLLDEAIAPDHPFAQKALGCRVNEIFKINDTDTGRDEWTVKSIKHKYLHILHHSMERFEQQFAGAPGLQSIPIDYSEEKPLDPIFDKIKARAEAVRFAVGQYEKGILPLQVIAEHLGGDILDIGQNLADHGCKLRVCIGITQERAAAIAAIRSNNKNGCVADALTLYVIRRLGIKDAVVATCGQIGVTQSTIDVFRRRREKIVAHGGRGFMTMYWSEGQFYREEITPEQLEAALKIADEELSWIEQNCEVLPAAGLTDPSAEVRPILETLGNTFLDPVLAAQGAKRLLLCEDILYRQIATQGLGVLATWLQPVLMQAVKQKFLTQDEYNEAIYRLIEAGHSFTSIDWQILAYLAKEEAHILRFKRVVETLFRKDAEINSHLAVAIHFLSKIWQRGCPSLHEMKLTGILLERLLLGEWHIKWREIAVFLQENMPSYAFNDYLIGWLRGHFLIPFGTQKISHIEKPVKKVKDKDLSKV